MKHHTNYLLNITIVLYLVLAISNPAYAQRFFTKLKPLPLRDYRQMEKKHNSIVKLEKSENFSFTNPASLVTKYIRVDSKMHPKPIITYSYLLPDSVVNEIEIEIDSLNFLDPTLVNKTPYFELEKRRYDFENFYNYLIKDCSNLLGKPHRSQPLKIEKNFGSTYFSQSDFWDSSTLTAESYLIFTISASKPFSNTYRIRTKINFKTSL